AYVRANWGANPITGEAGGGILTDSRFDEDYDRRPYARDNAVYDAVVVGLGARWGVGNLSGADQAAMLGRIDAIGIRAGFGRVPDSWLSPSHWAQDGALDRLNRQNLADLWVETAKISTHAAGELALWTAGGEVFAAGLAARNLARITAAGRRGLAGEAAAAERQLAQRIEQLGGSRFTDEQVRIWYNSRVAPLPGMNQQWLQQGFDLRARARMAYDFRHQARLDARLMMSDAESLRIIRARDAAKYGDPGGPTFEMLIQQHRARGMSLDDALETILGTSSRTDPGFNAKFGIGN
nr:hypothetical protein [Planctomycetota bacterium]